MRRYTAPPETAPRIFLGRIPSGYAGTLRTAEQVKRLIRTGAKDFYVRQHAIDVLLACGVPPKDYLGEIAVLFHWVQANVRYTKDPYRVEVLHAPRRMLELRAGDCDDMTILLGSLLESIGHPVRLVLTGPDPQRPRLFSHIYLEVNHHGRWIPCDATMPHPLGWAPRALVRKVIPLKEEPAHVSQGNVVGHTGRTAVAEHTDARDRARRRAAARPTRTNALDSSAHARIAESESVAQGPAALFLAEGVANATAPAHDAAHHDAAAALGDFSGSDPGDSNSPAERERVSARSRASVPPAATGTRETNWSGAADRTGGAQSLSGYIRHGTDLFRRFNQFEPRCITRVTHWRVLPPVVVQIGELVGLIYRSDKWQRGEPRTYIHVLRDPPRLVSDIKGQQLFMLGGSYRVTPRGIEG
jgi:Transglutaminase-like superfamily